MLSLLSGKARRMVVWVCVYTQIMVLFSPELRAATDADELPTPQGFTRFQDIITGSKTPDDSLWGELSRRLSIIIQQRPWFFSDEQIDKVVGDPATLQYATALRLRTLPVRLRLELYDTILNQIQRLGFVPSEMHGSPLPFDGRPPFLVTMDKKASEALLGRMISATKRWFTPEEFADLGVYLLSKLPFFPKDKESWNGIRHTVVNYDLVIGAAVILGMLATNNGSLGAGGYLYKVPGDTFRIGWYGSVDNLGFAWDHPSFRGGVQAGIPGLELRTGYAHQVHGHDFVDAIEFSIREQFMRLVKPSTQWELVGKASARYVLNHSAPERDGSWQMWGEIFLREQQFYDLGIFLRAEESQTPDMLRSDTKLSLSLGGALEPGGKIHRRAMESISVTIRDQIDYLDARLQDLADYDVRMDDFGTGRLRDDEERKLVEGFRLRVLWVDDARAQLRRHLAEYDSAREQVFLVDQRRKPDELKAGLGPLPLDLLERARSEAQLAEGTPVR